MLVDFLAQANPGVTGGGGDIVTIVYILTSISLIAGFVIGTYKYVQRQKRKWTEEGITRQKQNQAMAENTAQMVKNTQAIDKLTDKFTEFATTIRQELNGVVERVVKLESWRNNANWKE